MIEPMFFQIIARAADDPDLLREMLADPKSIETARDLTLPEQDLLYRLGAYDLTRVNRSALADVEDFMVEAIRLRIVSALEDPEVYASLLEHAEALRRAMSQLETERLVESLKERERAKTCALGLRVIEIVFELVALSVAMVRICAEENDPDES